jgi:hypothetical protein
MKMYEYQSFQESDKKVLMFYHLWHGCFTESAVNIDIHAPRNITRTIKENRDALNNEDIWGPYISYHYWGEPLFGYYDLAKDEYVIRKHAQMLTDGGVDGIVIDYSNYMGGRGKAYTKNELTNLLETYLKMREEGNRTPDVAIMCTWSAEEGARAANDFYEDFYSKDKYYDIWFKWEGKPLILVHPQKISYELKDFFTTRRPYPFLTPVDEENAWPWLSLYPQKCGYTKDNPKEVVSVGIAQNWSDSLDFFSARDEKGHFITRGRSWSSKGHKLLKDPTSSLYESHKGANFNECFERAIELDPNVIFVTGFNEWIAARFKNVPSWARMSKDTTPPFGAFCDAFTTEFSRDIEPTREEELKDSFYLMLVENVRRYKRVESKTDIIVPIRIEIDGNFDDWDGVENEYHDDVNDIANRHAQGIGRHVYVNTTGRNDFKLMKVAYDNDYIFFFCETVSDITPYTDENWMNLLLHVSFDRPHWEGYNFIVNRTGVRNNHTTLEKSLGGFNWEVVDDKIPYRVKGNKLELAIKRNVLGVCDKDIDFMFKWCDNIKYEDILNFYTDGDTAPNGRFNFRFCTKEVQT